MKSRLFFVILFFAIPAIASADEKLSADVTQQKYERKALLQILDIGMRSRDVKLAAAFCPYKAKICLPLGIWNFDISKKMERRASKQILSRLTGNRYDLVRLKPDQLEISTLFETLEVDSDVGEFHFNTGTHQEFKQRVNGYLDEKIAPLMSELLVKAKDARYQEMDDKEKETFLATIAKEQSVPASLLGRLLNSAFVFSEYLSSSHGNLYIREQKVKRFGRIFTEFSVDIQINIRMKLDIHRFNADSGKFDHYRTITVDSGMVSGEASVFPLRPTDALKVIGVFHNSFNVAARAAGIAANTDLKKDDNFAIFATVDQVDGNRLASAIGEAEDLRIDAPYKLRQQIDGKMVEVGWVKARSVAKQSLLEKSPGEYQSKFALIKGNVEFKDQMREHPWTGVFGFIGLGSANQELTEIEGFSASGGGDFIGLLLGAHMDLGYMLNSPGLSEGWLELSVFLGGGGQALDTDIGYWDSSSYLKADIDYVKRKQLGASGLYLGYKLGLSVSDILGSGSVFQDDLNVYAGGLHFGAQTGYLFSPNMETFLNVSGVLPFGAQYQIGTDGDQGDAAMSLGYTINLGFSFHVKSIGGFARLMR